MATDLYDRKFYDRIRSGCQASADAVAPIVLDRVGHVGTVVDVGCGEGWWAQAFHDAGVPLALGIDSGERRNPAPNVAIHDFDLTRPLGLAASEIGLNAGFDSRMVVCLEVAEHLPLGRAATFVMDLCDLAPLVLFSAAMPRQGGTGHINCQPPTYWADLFAAKGYTCDGSLRWVIWDDPDVEPWYKSNLLLFTKGGSDPVGHERPLHVIHPDLWLKNRR